MRLSLKNYQKKHYYYIDTKNTGIIRSSEGKPLDFFSIFQPKKIFVKSYYYIIKALEYTKLL